MEIDLNERAALILFWVAVITIIVAFMALIGIEAEVTWVIPP